MNVHLANFATLVQVLCIIGHFKGCNAEHQRDVCIIIILILLGHNKYHWMIQVLQLKETSLFS